MKLALKRGILVGAGLILQVALYLFLYIFVGEHLAIINFVYYTIGTIIVLSMIRNSKNLAFTLPWIIIILLFPLIGSLLYLIIGRSKRHSKTLKRITASEEKIRKYYKNSPIIDKEVRKHSKINYLTSYAKFEASNNNSVKYYPLGELGYEAMLKELKKAEKFIFFEYFIVATGTMWNGILEILKEKASQGVEVRVMYDDLGCISTLPPNYKKTLEGFGIKCVVFNPLSPIRGFIMNNRDHRKILVIDGKVAFSGGINIADEYINVHKRFGHWKDNAIKVSGDAVWSYTVMFLTMWNAYIEEDKDFLKYKYIFPKREANGYVIPYSETPLDEEITSEDVYLNIINQSHKYVYIFTPYLIIDTQVISSLILAAKRGVDVRIVIPGIPDKKIVYTVTESYLELLIKGGVKIYKYTPGFVHSKVFVSDDHIATVGTINLDYRSLYLNFECGLYMEKVDEIKNIKKDLEETINKSHRITEKESTPSLIKAIWQSILRIIAPLM